MPRRGASAPSRAIASTASATTRTRARVIHSPAIPRPFRMMSDDAAVLLDHFDRCVLVFAHPGHELRTYHFMERVRPSVSVLTDGSGSANVSRLDESRAALARTGARPAATFGVLTD